MDTPRALLITDCLQKDFVGPIDKFAGLPNALHIGHDESTRLLGEVPSEGPVARFLSWAHQQAKDKLTVIHVRDWHSADDPSQQSHLQQFGEHCIAGSEGAEFAFDLSQVAADKLNIVNATTLSNFIDADLGEALAPFREQKLRVGLMGVWTEAKITFLAYDLRSRYPQFELAVCAALTASSSRDNHFVALDQLERILGVTVIPSVGEFIEFLGGADHESPLLGFSQKNPSVLLPEKAQLSATDQQLLRYLFRGCKQVAATILDGGFSGNAVLGTTSTDLHGHEQVPHVVKIGPTELIGRERTCFERIESVLGNSAPRITDFADLNGRGAIKYRYAAMGGGTSQSFQKLYQQDATAEESARILRAVFDEQLGRFYRAAQSEYCDLLAYYEFHPKWANSVADKVLQLQPEQGHNNSLHFCNGKTLPNVARFYDQTLPTLPRTRRSHYFSYVHGDLNGANIIVDQQQNVWIIDFFHTHRGHVLRDLIKLESDIQFIFTPIESQGHLQQAMAFTDLLAEHSDLAKPLAALPSSITYKPLQRLHAAVNHLRGFYPPLIQTDRDPFQWQVAHLRYAVHTLGFDEPTSLQKQWALYSACVVAEQLTQGNARIGPLRIDWLPNQYTSRGKLGLTIAPGRLGHAAQSKA